MLRTSEPLPWNLPRRARTLWKRLLAIGIWLAIALCPVSAWAQVQYVYDAAGRLIGVSAPNGDAAQYVYDAAGNITQINRFSASTLSLIQFSPEAGLFGTPVTIFGTGFNSTLSANTVTFNGMAATVSSGTTNWLVAAVPVGATTGPISVTNGANTVTSSRSFSVTQSAGPPTISNFTPTVGTVGTSIAISGTNFDPRLIYDLVWFNGTGATVRAATSTSLTTSVPGAASSGKIKVSTLTGTATSAADFFIPPPGYTAANVGATGRIAIDGSTLPLNIPPGKIALVLFDGAAGQNIGVGIGPVAFTPSGSTATVSVINPSGTTLATAAFNAGTSLHLSPLPASGGYTIVIATGAAQLSLTLTASSDLIGAFGSLGSTVTFNASRVGQYGRYTFSGTSGEGVSLIVGNDTIASERVEVRGPSGTVVASSTVGAGGGTIPIPPPPISVLQATGTYTVFLSPVADSVGQLDMQLAGADLTVSDASVGTITLNSDGSYSIPVSFTVHNFAGATAGPSWSEFVYLSNDPVLDDNDPVLGWSGHAGTMAPNASYVAQGLYKTPTTQKPGNYTLIIKTDGHGGGVSGPGTTNTDSGNVIEVDETNNTQSLSITLPAKSDLVVSGGAVGTITIHENGSYIIPVTFTVSNIGGATASPIWYDVGYLSKSPTLDDSAVLTGNTTHGTALAPNASYVVNATHGAPIVTTSGTYKLFLKADGRSPLLDGGQNTDYGHVPEADEANNVETLTIVLPGKPDLTVTSASIGAIMLNHDGSYSFPVTYTVKNVGQLQANVDDYAGGWWDMGYLSLDGTLDDSDPRISGVPSDIYSSPRRTTPLAAGASYTTTATYVTPTTTTPGPHTLFVKANGNPYGVSGTGPLIEENPNNNAKALAITLPGKPDLIVSSASVGTVTVDRDGTYRFPLTYTVKNVGQSAAQPYWFDMAYLSTDAVFDNNDSVIRSLADRSTALAVGASYTATLNLWLWAEQGPATYTVFVKADAEDPLTGTNTGPGYLSEADETNNARAVTLTLPVKADLTVTSASVGAITISGSNYNIPLTFTVKNVGGSTAQPSWVDWVYLSVDGVLDINDVGLTAVNGANSRTASLAAGATYTKTVTFTAPTTLGPGPRTLFIKADGDSTPTSGGALVEANEVNNALALAVTLPAQMPDLTVSSLTVGTPITVAQNGAYSFPVTYKVINSGLATATPSWYDVGYLSSDGTLDTAAVLTGYRQRTTALAPAASYTITATFTTDTTTTPRSYTLFLKADGQGGPLGGSNTDSGKLAEADETNNVRSVTLTLPNKPDLTMSIVSIGTIVKNTNGSYKIPVTYKVTNSGGAPAQASWYDTAYLSGNATLDDTPDAALAGYHTQTGALAVNGSYTVIGTFTTSTTTPAGTYTLFVKADGRSVALGGTNTDAGKVTEASETNNTASISVVLP